MRGLGISAVVASIVVALATSRVLVAAHGFESFFLEVQKLNECL